MASRSRIALAIFLTALSGCFLWYSICTYKISGNDTTGLVDFTAGFFPQALVLKGNSRYLALDPAGAEMYYKKAILAEPSLIDAWIGLVRVQIANANKQQALKTLDIIAPSLGSISTWKWQELLFAYNLHDDPYFQKCFNYILSYLPDRVEGAAWLSSRFWGGWEKILPHVLPSNYPVFLRQLIDWRQPDAAIALFKIMEKQDTPWEKKEKLQFCNFLISNDRLKEAKNVWRLWRKSDVSLIYDGGFEKGPLNMAFGWRFQINPDFTVKRTTRASYSGNWCLHVHFKGKRNIDSDVAYQIVPVSPGAAYTLRFARKAANLTTDHGVFLEVTDFKHSGFKAVSEQVLGDSAWKSDKIEFTVPAGCEAVVLHVRRNYSLKLDDRISGDYWLDSVKLVRK